MYNASSRAGAGSGPDWRPGRSNVAEPCELRYFFEVEQSPDRPRYMLVLRHRPVLLGQPAQDLPGEPGGGLRQRPAGLLPQPAAPPTGSPRGATSPAVPAGSGFSAGTGEVAVACVIAVPPPPGGSHQSTPGRSDDDVVPLTIWQLRGSVV